MKSKFLYLVFLLALLSLTTSALAEGNGNETLVNETPTNETHPYNTTVWYEPEILDVFDNKLQRPGFDNNTHARVIVYLKDNSNITVTGTKEERRNLSRQVNEWFEPVVKGLLATLSEDEFRIIGKPMSRGFAGYLTMKGFDKLIADERVSEIHLDFLLQLYGEDEWQMGESEENNSDNQTLHRDSQIIENETDNGQTDLQITVLPEDMIGPRLEPVEPKLSWFGRLIQFLKSLFGLK